MQNISHQEFKLLIEKAIVLAEDEYGKKVLELTDHSIIKLFRVKRFISQASLYSPARRFAKNAVKLRQLNIPTIRLINLYKIKSIKRTAVHYQQLEGIMVREYLQSNKDNSAFLEQLGKFLAHLHNKGVFFRSAHFGNIIVTPDQQFGLIDISDMSISTFPLSPFKRLRNLKHIFRLKVDIQLLNNSDAIEQSYLDSYKTQSKLFKKTFLETAKNLKIANG